MNSIQVLSGGVIFALGCGVFVGIFLFLLDQRHNKRIKKFLLGVGKETWIKERVYVREKDGGSSFFIEPIQNKKIFYDTLESFDRKLHCPPAHIETVLDIRTGEIKTTKTAYVSYKKLKELVVKSYHDKR